MMLINKIKNQKIIILDSQNLDLQQKSILKTFFKE